MDNPHDYRAVSSELLLEAPIIAVRRDEVTMPGETTAKREVVEHMGAVAIVAMDEEDRVAMVDQYRHSVGQRLREIPAGLLDIAGEDPLTAAQRELQEEAGLEASSWELLVDIVNSPGYSEEACRVFLARGLTEVDREQSTGDEEADMGFTWKPLEDAISAIFRGEISNSIAVAGILAAATLNGRGRDPHADFELRPTSIAQRRSGPDLKAL